VTNAENEITPELARQMAAAAGLNLSAEEVEKLMVGIQRNRQMAQRVRAIVTPDLEPAPVFDPTATIQPS